MLRTATLRLLVQLSVTALCLVGASQRSLGQEGAPEGQLPKLSQDIEQVLWWLPEQTEAVVVSRGNVPAWSSLELAGVTFGPGSRAPQMDDYPKHSYQDLMAKACIDPLVHFYPYGNAQNEMIKVLFGRKSASLFVKAVWWREDSTREICDIIVFRDNTASQIIDMLTPFPNTPRKVDGVRALEIDMDPGDADEYWRPIPFDLNDLIRPPRTNRYLAAPWPNVYVAATSSELLRVIIERMNRRGANRALPSQLTEWRHLDPTVPAWGLRHYHPAIADKDPLSMVKWDPNAEGLVFFGGSTPSPFVCLRYVSRSEDAGIRFLRMKANWLHIRDISKMLPMQRINADCVETKRRTNVSEAEAKRDRWSLNIVATTGSLSVTYYPLLGFSCPELAIKSE